MVKQIVVHTLAQQRTNDSILDELMETVIMKLMFIYFRHIAWRQLKKTSTGEKTAKYYHCQCKQALIKTQRSSYLQNDVHWVTKRQKLLNDLTTTVHHI